MLAIKDSDEPFTNGIHFSIESQTFILYNKVLRILWEKRNVMCLNISMIFILKSLGENVAFSYWEFQIIHSHSV